MLKLNLLLLTARVAQTTRRQMPSGSGSAATLYTEYPALFLVSCCLKFGPVRGHLEFAAKEVLRGGSSRGFAGLSGRVGTAGLSLDGPTLQKILVKLAQLCHGEKMPGWVADNANVQHHSGFLPFLQKLGVISKLPAAGHASDSAGASDGRSRRRSAAAVVVQLGEQGSHYEVVSGGKVLPSIAALAALGLRLGVLLQRLWGGLASRRRRGGGQWTRGLLG